MKKQLYIHGQVVEVSEHDVLNLVGRSIESAYTVAEALLGGHLLGLPDIRGAILRPYFEGELRFEESLELQLDDEELRGEFRAFLQHLHKLIEVDRKMGEWLARWVGLPSIQEEQDRGRLYRKISRQAEKAMQAGNLPDWMLDSEYRTLVEEAKQVMAEASEAKQRIEQRLRQLSRPLSD